jgi:hypothetical protein
LVDSNSDSYSWWLNSEGEIRSELKPDVLFISKVDEEIVEDGSAEDE